MTKILTGLQMRGADEYTTRVLGGASQTLMERAGNALAKKAVEMTKNGRVLCVCGGGNNGGDGFICARLLKNAGYETDVVCVANRFSPDCQVALDKFRSAGGVTERDFPSNDYALVIDCLLGTGFKGELSEVYKNAIGKINGYKKAGAKVLSADIPSGVNGDNGEVGAIAVLADATVCMGEYKSGVFLGDGVDYAGEIVRADIGISLPEESYALLTDKADVAALLSRRKRNTHKGSYGKAAIVAGCAEYTGAAYLATAACLRSGAGYTALFTPAELLCYYMLKAPEALLKPLCKGDRANFDEKSFSALLSYDSVAYGMGMGCSIEVAKGAAYLLQNYTGKLILDADALNALAEFGGENVFQNKKCDVVITPHVKEFSRLTGENVSEILKKGLFAATDFSKRNGISVLLKNAVSVITDGQNTYVNATGNAGQAKGGSGDVLAGVIAGLCAQGFSAINGARVGGYIVGKAAEIAARTQDTRSVLASDIIGCLGKAFLEIYD
ncbi:MAG: NAD(P)H-hydrate dehydratase [Clostridia bacterium]|nr:NAD(P)H-hydrate dehydratase [Clostridia bacterium]